MKQQVGALGNEMLAIVFDRRDHRLDRLFAELLGTVLRSLVEQLARIGGFATGRCAGVDGCSQVVKGKTCHLALSSRSGSSAGVQCPALVYGSSRVGRPARAMCSLASRMVNS